MIDLKLNNSGYYDLDFLKPKDWKFGSLALFMRSSLIDSSSNNTGVIVEFNHLGGYVQLLEASGFTASGVSLRGVLSPLTMKKATVRFALMNPLMDDPTEVPYISRDVYFYAIRKAPTVIKEFQLECAI